MWASKLGLRSPRAGAKHWAALEPLLRQHPTDWTIFWRQLGEAARRCMGGNGRDLDSAEFLAALSPAFYSPLPWHRRAAWIAWGEAWITGVREEGDTAETVVGRMHSVNPKCSTPLPFYPTWRACIASTSKEPQATLAPLASPVPFRSDAPWC